jgi:Xaa-Pro aminopeptidase
MDTNIKLSKVRVKMEECGIDALIIPSTDPHASEYVHPHWKTRAYISGFNGSAGTLVITKTEAGLWTDFRYYIEAEQSITETGIKLYKQGLLDTPSVNDFLKNKLSKNSTIGIDGQVFTTSAYEDIKKSLGDGYKIVKDFDPATIWENRPEMPNSMAYELEKNILAKIQK